MATTSEMNQTAVNGMNTNGNPTTEDKHVFKHDSPSKSIISNSQDGPRLQSTTEISVKEKTPVPEQHPASQQNNVHPAVLDKKSPDVTVQKCEPPKFESPVKATADPTGVVVPTSPALAPKPATTIATSPKITAEKPVVTTTASVPTVPAPTVAPVPAAVPVVEKKPVEQPAPKPTSVEPPKPPAAVVVEPKSSVAEDKPAAKLPESAAAEPTTEPPKETPDVDMTDLTDGDKKETVEVEGDAPTEDAVVSADAESTETSPGKQTSRKAASRKSVTPKKAPVVVDGTVAEGTTEETKRERTPRKRKTTGGDEDSSADKTPLLEAPLVVEGKRSRQRVERLDATILGTPDKKELEIPSGRGQKLSEISFVESMISKTSANDLKPLHRILFGKLGTVHEIKKNIRQFNGFGFDATDMKECDKKKKQFEHATLPDLKNICGILGLEKTAKKDELVEALLNYLIEPTDKGKKVPTPAAKRGRKRSAPSGSAKRKTPGRKAAKKSEDEDEEDEDQADAGESGKEKSETEEEEVVEPTPKKAKKGKAAATPAPSSSKKAATQSTRSAKKPAFPTDSDLKSTIKDLLKGVNLEAVTMKEMTSKVYDKFPGADLTSKKEFIKETVKALLSATD